MSLHFLLRELSTVAPISLAERGHLVHKQMLNLLLLPRGFSLAAKMRSCSHLILQLAGSSRIFKAELRRQKEKGREEGGSEKSHTQNPCKEREQIL